jgi:hypothetical protein
MIGWLAAALVPAWQFAVAHWYLGTAAIAGMLIVLAIVDRRVP